MAWWTKKEKEILQDLFDSAIGSDNTDYILEKLSKIYNMIWDKHIDGENNNWELIGIKENDKNE